jgi:hypothetical protein
VRGESACATITGAKHLAERLSADARDVGDVGESRRRRDDRAKARHIGGRRECDVQLGIVSATRPVRRGTGDHRSWMPLTLPRIGGANTDCSHLKDFNRSSASVRNCGVKSMMSSITSRLRA